MDPRHILCEFKKYLAPNGRIVVEVPSSSDTLLTLYESELFQHFTYWSQHLYPLMPELWKLWFNNLG